MRKREKRPQGDVDVLIALLLYEMFDVSSPPPGLGLDPSRGNGDGVDPPRSGRSAAGRRREGRRSTHEPQP